MLKENPKHYNEINIIYETIWRSLVEGVNNRSSDFHTFALATTDGKRSAVRTVVLRSCSKKELSISFHTNNYSNKINEIKENSNVEGLFYSKNKKIQIRISGQALIFNDVDICHTIWKNMSQDARDCYMYDEKPGTRIKNPKSIKKNTANKANKNFSLININIQSIEWLYLSSSGHRRVSFNKENSFVGDWIVP
tara:strand:+ start:344 stop:925 length:582 start_codon:yes stop_codon:yes gene_type:complete